MATPQSHLDQIHRAFATVSLIWNQSGENMVEDVSAIPLHDDGGLAFSGSSSALRKVFEIQKSAVPFKPQNGDCVIDGDDVWRVIEVINYRPANAWRVFVEEDCE